MYTNCAVHSMVNIIQMSYLCTAFVYNLIHSAYYKLHILLSLHNLYIFGFLIVNICIFMFLGLQYLWLAF